MPLAIGLLFQFSTTESTSILNLRRDTNPIRVQIIAVLSDGVVTSRRQGSPDCPI
jgi:hypothetical protein